MKTHTIWKTITIGTDKNIAKNLDCNISSYAKDMIEKIDFSHEKEEVNLVKVTLSDWFGDTYPTTTKIFERAEKEGLELCPPKTALYLRKQYTDQPLYEWLIIGMKQITDSAGYPYVFEVGHNSDGLWLNGRWARPGYTWRTDYRFVFRLKNNLMDRVLSKVEEFNDCWIWNGAKRKGYGIIGKGKRGQGNLSVHRVVYTNLIGEIPKDMVIDHLCRKRACVNPFHLETVSNKENILRGNGVTAINNRKEKCIRGHLLYGENIYEIKNKRYCKLCQNIYKKTRKSLSPLDPSSYLDTQMLGYLDEMESLITKMRNHNKK